MLDYDLPPTPVKGQRWFISGSALGKQYRYLHLERKHMLGFWVTVHKDMIHTGPTAQSFQFAVKDTAKNILREINVVFKYPTGEVR